jgi:hypothetical protein
MPVVDIVFAAREKWGHWRRLDGGGGQIRPGIMSRTQGHGLTSDGSQPAGFDILLCQFHQKQQRTSVS